MRIYTFYDHIPAHDNGNELKMLSLWRAHHARLGFQPFVLQEWHAQRHPRYAQFCEAIEKLPSINPKQYDRACYLRWLAVAAAALEGMTGPHIMMDYDTWLTPSVYDDLNPVLAPDRPDALHVYQNATPCIVSGPGKAFEQACIWFASFKPAEGEKHLSDMVILERVAAQEPEAYVRYNYAKCYGEPNWTSAPALHFSNACMIPAGKGPRCNWIPKLLAEHCAPAPETIRPPVVLEPGFTPL